MKYKELKSIVEQVINELNLAQGKNRIPKKNLDPVGKEDGDVDNDGDKDKTDKYLLKKRKAISKNINKEGYNPEEEDDVITADPDTDIEEPQRLPKRRHPLMPPEEAPESEPKMEEEIKKTIKDLMSRYKSLKK